MSISIRETGNSMIICACSYVYLHVYLPLCLLRCLLTYMFVPAGTCIWRGTENHWYCQINTRPYTPIFKNAPLSPRAAACQGLMRPIAVDEGRKSSYRILQQCVVCGHERWNKAQPEDQFETILSIVKEQTREQSSSSRDRKVMGMGRDRRKGSSAKGEKTAKGGRNRNEKRNEGQRRKKQSSHRRKRR